MSGYAVALKESVDIFSRHVKLLADFPEGMTFFIILPHERQLFRIKARSHVAGPALICGIGCVSDLRLTAASSTPRSAEIAKRTSVMKVLNCSLVT